MREIIFRYVYQNTSTDEIVSYNHTIESVEESMPSPSNPQIGYILMSRDEWIGTWDYKGNKIFENDIVKTDEGGWIAQVIYNNRDSFVCIDKQNGFSCECNWEKFEVVGDIHRNPRILDKTESKE